MLSWFTAISLTPFFASIFFAENKGDTSEEQTDPYKGFVFVAYKKVLNLSMRHAWTSISIMLVMLVASLYGFSQLKQAFFPSSTTPMFMVDVWLPEGSDIRTTDAKLIELEKVLNGYAEVKQVSSSSGQGSQRFMLTYSPEKSYAAYGELIVRLDSYDDVMPILARFSKQLDDNQPNIEYKLKRVELGPSSGSKIEARIIGADPTILRGLAKQVSDIMRAVMVLVNRMLMIYYS